MTNKANIINSLYAICGIRESNLVNFSDFKRAIIFLGENLLDSKRNDFGDVMTNYLIRQMKEENIPDVQTLGNIFSENFNTIILVLIIGDNYENTHEFIELKPDNINEETDYVVIIQKSHVHFGLLIPLSSDLFDRHFLYDTMKQNFI